MKWRVGVGRRSPNLDQMHLVMYICITRCCILHPEEAAVQFFLHMDRLLEQRFLPEMVQKLVIFTFGPSIGDALSISRVTKKDTRNGTRSEFVRIGGCYARVTPTTKDSKTIVGR